MKVTGIDEIGSCNCTLAAEDDEIEFTLTKSDSTRENRLDKVRIYSQYFFIIVIRTLYIILCFGAYFIQSWMQSNYIIGQFPQAIQYRDMSDMTKATRYFMLDLTEESDETYVKLEIFGNSGQTIIFSTRFQGNNNINI